MKFNRRFFLSLTTILLYGLLGKSDQKTGLSQEKVSRDKNIIGINPKPDKPKIIGGNIYRYL